VARIFLKQGFQIGLFGIAAGTALGLILLKYRNDVLGFIRESTGFELFPRDVYLFDGLPAEIHYQDVIGTVVFAMVVCVVAAVYPAHRASRFEPVEALRYE
jgi:lipoprotein-releasing system permease protein